MPVVKRPIYVIAEQVRRNWVRPYFGAVPYIDAMDSIDDINDMYGQDTARSIVRYFLGNAQTWRGEVARTVKAELKGMLN